MKACRAEGYLIDQVEQKESYKKHRTKCLTTNALETCPWPSPLVAAGTASASTADTLDCLFFLELRLGYSADAGGIEIGLLRLDTTETAQLW